MSSPSSGALPRLDVADFAPGQDHVTVAYQGGRICAILHRNDPAHPHLPNLFLDPNDPFTYVFVHGGQEFTRFENLKTGTHEIPAAVVAALLANHFGTALDGMKVRMCTCYGTCSDLET
jgi:hypothetical protein